MQINEAITKTKAYRDGYEYTYEQMVGWLSACDQMLWDQFLRHYKRDDLPERPTYGTDTDGATQLLVPDPYSDLYVHYLSAQMCYWNHEVTGYANSKEQYEVILNAYKAEYMKQYDHICDAFIKGVL